MPVPMNRSTDLDSPGGRIKFLRQAKGMSQENLAKLVFRSQPQVSRWETNKDVPDDATQQRLAHVLGADWFFIFGRRAA